MLPAPIPRPGILQAAQYADFASGKQIPANSGSQDSHTATTSREFRTNPARTLQAASLTRLHKTLRRHPTIILNLAGPDKLVITGV